MAVAALAGLLLLLTAPAAQETTTPETGQQEATARQELWGAKCAECHGKKGLPTPVGDKLGARNLTTREVQELSDQDLRTVIVDGTGKMPGYEDTLSAAEIELLIEQIRSFAVEPGEDQRD